MTLSEPQAQSHAIVDRGKDPEDQREDRRAEQDRQQPALDDVQDEGFGRGFVEAVFFFDDEGAVDAEGQADDLAEQHEDSAPKTSPCTIMWLGCGLRDAVHPAEPAEQDEGDRERKHNPSLDLQFIEAGVVLQVVLRLGVFFVVVDSREIPPGSRWKRCG